MVKKVFLFLLKTLIGAGIVIFSCLIGFGVVFAAAAWPLISLAVLFGILSAAVGCYVCEEGKCW